MEALGADAGQSQSQSQSQSQAPKQGQQDSQRQAKNKSQSQTQPQQPSQPITLLSIDDNEAPSQSSANEQVTVRLQPVVTAVYDTYVWTVKSRSAPAELSLLYNQTRSVRYAVSYMKSKSKQRMYHLSGALVVENPTSSDIALSKVAVQVSYDNSTAVVAAKAICPGAMQGSSILLPAATASKPGLIKCYYAVSSSSRHSQGRVDATAVLKADGSITSSMKSARFKFAGSTAKVVSNAVATTSHAGV